MIKPKNIVELVQLLSERPAMYIGKTDIFCLMAFLNGYVWAKEDDKDLLLMNEFQLSIQAKYNIVTSQSWASIISFFNTDSQKAIEVFFSDFSDFISTKY